MTVTSDDTAIVPASRTAQSSASIASGPVLAIDIGGTKMAVGAVDASGRVLAETRVPTPPGADAETLYKTVTDAIAQLPYQKADFTSGIGVGCGGPMRWPAGEVSPLNIHGWRGFPLRRRLEEDFQTEVRLHNDAICLAAAEHWRGAGVGAKNMLGMVVSTGVGGGLILGDRLIDGAQGNAGHIGHVVVDRETPCACGGIGCLEAVASGPRIAKWAHEQGWRAADRPENRTGKTLTEDARAGDAVAVAALRRAGTAVGIAIASAAALCDLELVTIGGGVSQAGDLLFGPLDEALKRHARLDFTKGVKVVPAQLGQDAGLVGAAALVLQGEAYWSACFLPDRTAYGAYVMVGPLIVCVSVNEPSPPVNATSTFGGSVTAASSTWTPSIVTTMWLAAVMFTVTVWAPLFRIAASAVSVATAFRFALPKVAVPTAHQLACPYTPMSP
jgi:glucokinase